MVGKYVKGLVDNMLFPMWIFDEWKENRQREKRTKRGSKLGKRKKEKKVAS